MPLSGCISEPSSAAVFLLLLRRGDWHLLEWQKHTSYALYIIFTFLFINLSSASLSLAHSSSLAVTPSLSLSQIPPLFHLIFSNLLRFPHLLSSHCLPPSLSLLGILQSHSQACEVKDLCNLFSPYILLFLSFFVCRSLYSGADLPTMWRLQKSNTPLVFVWRNCKCMCRLSKCRQPL